MSQPGGGGGGGGGANKMGNLGFWISSLNSSSYVLYGKKKKHLAKYLIYMLKSECWLLSGSEIWGGRKHMF